MHCPDGIKGEDYILAVAAASLMLSKNLDQRDTFVLAEFLQNVSIQLFTLAAFKPMKK